MLKFSMKFFYKTINGNVYPLELFVKDAMVDALIYEPETVKEMCRTGCSNFGRSGGCPPRAPSLEELYSSNQRAWIIICRFDSLYKPDKVKNSNNSAIHWKFQDGILARVLNKLGHALTEVNGGSFLATGYCMGCPGKKCAFKLGLEECRNPKRRTFSMEATGINVVKTVKDSFGFDLHWYKKGKTDIPYMMKCMVFFPEQNKGEIDSVLEIIKTIPSCQ